MLWVFHGTDVTHTMYCMGETIHPQVQDIYFSYFKVIDLFCYCLYFYILEKFHSQIH